jgi:hypothetical protein
MISCIYSVGEINIDSHYGTSDRAPQTSPGGHKEVCNTFHNIFLNGIGTLGNLLFWCHHIEVSLLYYVRTVNNFVGLTFLSYLPSLKCKEINAIIFLSWNP